MEQKYKKSLAAIVLISALILPLAPQAGKATTFYTSAQVAAHSTASDYLMVRL